MKRLFILIMIFTMAWALIACSADNDTETVAEENNDTEIAIEENNDTDDGLVNEDDNDVDTPEYVITEDGMLMFVSNLQPDLPTPVYPKKVQLDWIIAGAGGDDAGRVDGDGEHLPPHESVTGIFSYQFVSDDGELSGRVVGEDGVISVFALRNNGTYILINDELDPEIVPNAEEIYEFATMFTEHFATMTRTGHTHTFPPDLGVKSTEDFPIYEGSDRMIIFYYDGDNYGGMMMAMEFEGAVKFVSNLQPDFPTPIFPKKVQLDWIIAGAGGDDAGRIDADGEHLPPHDSVTGVFSYQFVSEDGELRGRVEGVLGEIRVFAFRDDGTYVLIDAETTSEQVPNAEEIFEFVSMFTAHFATMTRTAHTHTFPPDFGVKSTEDFPIYEGSSRMIVFYYDGDDDGGMMMAMEFEGAVKFVSDLQPSLPATIVPKRAQVDWLIAGAGGDGLFSFHFANEDGELQGRIVGEHGEVRIYAIRDNGTYALIDDDVNLEQVPNAVEIYLFATMFAEHFATSTRTDYAHAFPPDFGVKPAEAFLIYEGSDRMMVFYFDGDNYGGMMTAIELR